MKSWLDRPQVREEDPVTIIYTSGTSGEAKGVVLTAANVGFMLGCTLARLDSLNGRPRRTRSHLPLSAVQLLRVVDRSPYLYVARKSGYAQHGAVIHYDPWWNPAAQAQATDRQERNGQTKPVFVHDLIVAGSVEERMLGLQRHKRALADAILADRGAASASLTDRDVDDLLATLP